jgi:hypothetical protein
MIRGVREHRAPYVKPTEIARRCATCGTDFVKTDGGAPERGLWQCSWGIVLLVPAGYAVLFYLAAYLNARR